MDEQLLFKISRMKEVGEYYLSQSFQSINSALVIDMIDEDAMREKLSQIKLTKEDEKLNSKNSKRKYTIEEMLKGEAEEFLTQETIDKLSDAWYSSLDQAVNLNKQLSKEHYIQGVEVVGFATNYIFFLETVLNRHLKYLNIINLIKDVVFKKIEYASVEYKILYLFKEEINNGKIPFESFNLLNKLRNNSVHFKLESTVKIQIQVRELINIWKHSIVLLKEINNAQKFDEIPFWKIVEEQLNSFEEKWLKK